MLASILGHARAQRSVHYASWHSLGAAGHLAITADVARDRGVQHVTLTFEKKSSDIEIVVVARTAYVRGGLEDLVGLRRGRAARYAGRWISIPSGDRLYGQMVTAVTLNSFLRRIEPPGRLEAIEGTKAVEVRGRSRTGEVDLRARRSGLLPIEATDVAGGGMGHATLSRRNEAVMVRAPGTAVPIATVRS